MRQWQERFRAGDFSSRDLSVQCEAGWYDWFCRDDALAGRLKKISGVVLGITDPFILDNYYVWFKNNCPMAGPLYDDVRFEPLSGERDGKYFVVTLDSPHELIKWMLYTERYGYDAPEFCCGNVREMGQYIKAWPPELEQGIQPRLSCWRSGRSEVYPSHEGEHASRMAGGGTRIQLHPPGRPTAAEGNGHGQLEPCLPAMARNRRSDTGSCMCLAWSPLSQKGPLSGRKLFSEGGRSDEGAESRSDQGSRLTPGPRSWRCCSPIWRSAAMRSWPF